MVSDIQSFLTVSNVLVDLDAACKRGVLKEMSAHAAAAFDLNADVLLDRLHEREQLGTTGIGDGVAVPHARTELTGLHGILARLKHPVDFDAVDDRPVDLVFMLLAPEQAEAEHLKALSKIARLVRERSVRHAMRGAQDAQALYAIAVGNPNAEAA